MCHGLADALSQDELFTQLDVGAAFGWKQGRAGYHSEGGVGWWGVTD